MQKYSRNSRISAITKILIENPNKIMSLNYFSEMLNAAQQRKARVGAGFETHIRALLEAGAIPFAEQKVVSSLR